MQRSIVALVVLFSLFTPAPALAWFGWLDHLSGPGPYWGLLFDVRVICFGDRTAQDLIRQAQEAERLALAEPDNVQRWQDAAAAWQAVTTWLVYQAPFQDQALIEGLLTEKSSEKREVLSPETAAARIVAARQTVERERKKIARMASVGVLFTICPPDMVRRSSIDVAMNFWQSTHRDPAFAGGEAILLSKAKVSYSFRLFANPDRDVLDMSMGVGAYWFTSRGFNPVRGLFLEPARAYVHAPSSWGSSTKGWQRALALPVFSAGLVLFPRGFEAGAFGQEGRYAAELLPTFAIFINLHPTRK